MCKAQALLLQIPLYFSPHGNPELWKKSDMSSSLVSQSTVVGKINLIQIPAEASFSSATRTRTTRPNHDTNNSLCVNA